MADTAAANGDSVEERQRLLTGAQILRELLARSRDGCVSTQALRKELEARDIAEPLELIGRLKSLDHNPEEPDEHARWRHFGRSFYTETRYREAQAAQDEEASQAEAADTSLVDESEASLEEDEQVAVPRERSRRRREEARLGTYVVPVLEEIYDEEAAPDTYVFDVHSMRGGNDFENVDLLAIHWRSPKIVDVVTVEVKLRFTAFLVQQARNYLRFSERVWIAVPVESITANGAAMELRSRDQLLFEHVVDVGIGIFACHRGRGSAYDVFPVHWPKRNIVDPREREAFVKRYQPQFEESGVIPPAMRTYPKL